MVDYTALRVDTGEELDWMTRYNSEIGRQPLSPQQLLSFVRNRNGSLTYAAARELIKKASPLDRAVEKSEVELHCSLSASLALQAPPGLAKLLMYVPKLSDGDSKIPDTTAFLEQAYKMSDPAAKLRKEDAASETLGLAVLAQRAVTDLPESPQEAKVPPIRLHLTTSIHPDAQRPAKERQTSEDFAPISSSEGTKHAQESPEDLHLSAIRVFHALSGKELAVDLSRVQNMAGVRAQVAALSAVDTSDVDLSGFPEELDDVTPIATLAEPTIFYSISDDHWARMLLHSTCLREANDTRARCEAAKSLCEIGKEVELDEQACQALGNVLTEDPHSGIWRVVSNSLGKMGEHAKPVVPHLCKIMLEHETPESRRRARDVLCETLSNLAVLVVAETCSALQTHRNGHVRQRAVGVFRNCTFQKHAALAVPVLGQAIVGDKDVAVRKDAADVLGLLSETYPPAADKLIDLSRHATLSVRRHALQALAG